MTVTSDHRVQYQRDGYVVVRDLLPRSGILALRAHAAELVFGAPSDSSSVEKYVQRAVGRDGKVKFVKLGGLVERDADFRALGTKDELVDVVESLLGEPARLFRDVLVVKPAGRDGSLSYHQDSAYWDIEPKALVSAWICLGDVVDDSSSPLRVVPGSHRSLIEHSLLVRGHELPRAITRTLRKLVSAAGTGDNPDGAGGHPLVWRSKRWVLSEMTRYAPVLFDLQDYRIPPAQLTGEQGTSLAVRAGDVVFFHSLLWHASGPNHSNVDRYAEIVSFMGASSRFVGRGRAEFPLARRCG